MCIGSNPAPKAPTPPAPVAEAPVMPEAPQAPSGASLAASSQAASDARRRRMALGGTGSQSILTSTRGVNNVQTQMKTLLGA